MSSITRNPLPNTPVHQVCGVCALDVTKCRIVGNLAGTKFVGWICPKKLLAVFKFGEFAQKSYWRFLNLAELPKTLHTIISGTEKCLVALAGPFSVAYFPVFGGMISIGTLSSTAFLSRLPHMFIHLLCYFLR